MSTPAVGDTAPVLSHELTRTDLVRYAGASLDFNPMHHDEPRAQAAGLPSVFGHGMLSMALLANGLTAFVGLENLRKYQVRFTRQTWPGDRLHTEIEVTQVSQTEAGTEVELECSLLNQHGESVVEGRAMAVL